MKKKSFLRPRCKIAVKNVSTPQSTSNFNGLFSIRFWVNWKKLSVRTAYYQVGIGIFCVLPCDDGMKLAEGWETEKYIDYIGTKVNADFPFLPENPR